MKKYFILLSLILITGISAFGQKVEILETGAFHGEEVSAATGEIWQGLFKQGGSYSLLPVVLSVENVHDPVVDNDESEKTGKEVKILGQENPVFLIRGKNFEQSRIVKTVFEGENRIGNDFNETYDFAGKTYNLKVESEKKDDKFPEYLNKTSKLVLSEGSIRQTLYSVESCDDCSWQIKWAGDLDGDGKLDFYMQLSPHYNAAIMKLFLSSGAENGKLVKEAAEFISTGC